MNIKSTTVPRALRKYQMDANDYHVEVMVYVCVDENGYDFYHAIASGERGDRSFQSYNFDTCLKWAKDWL